MTSNKAPYGYLAVLKLMQRAGYDPALRPAARRILMILAGYSDTDGGCWPSMAQIAKQLGVSRAAIIQQVKALEARNYLRKTSRFDPETGRQKSNLYVLNIHDVVSGAEVTPSVKSEGDGGGKEYFITPEGKFVMLLKENT